jgi:hypothetical protein
MIGATTHSACDEHSVFPESIVTLLPEPTSGPRRSNAKPGRFQSCFLVTALNYSGKRPCLGNHSQNSKKLQSAPVLYSRGWFCQGRIDFPKRFHSCHYRQNDSGRKLRFDTPT